MYRWMIVLLALLCAWCASSSGGERPTEISKRVDSTIRRTPRAFGGGKQLHVYPKDSSSRGYRFKFARSKEGRKKAEGRRTFLGIMPAYKAAQPGDTLYLHKGIYRTRTGYRLKKSGKPGKPIVFRGNVDGEAVIEASGENVTLFDIGGTSHLWFEQLTLRGGACHFSGGKADERGGSDIVIRRCRSVGAAWSVDTLSPDAKNWYVGDNRIEGKRESGEATLSNGIRLAGKGHVLCYNRLARLGEAIRIGAVGAPGGIEICNNDFADCKSTILGGQGREREDRIYRNRSSEKKAAQVSSAETKIHYGPRSFNQVVPGEFIVDAPTLENLGFRWYIHEDENRNAKVEVAFRKKGEDAWKEALPMLRVQHEVVGFRYPGLGIIVCGNLFAGSVLFLAPATEYEVRFTMTDPDGGAPEESRVVTVATRGVPKVFEQGRKLHVYPKAYQGEREPGSYSGIMAAYLQARPGDILLLHAGMYKTTTGYRLTKSGAPGRPIVFRGGIDGETVIQADGGKVTLLDINGTNHLWFENLTLKDGWINLRAGERGDAGASDIVIRRCRSLGSKWGILTASENSKNWYVADNIVVGNIKSWYPFLHTHYSGIRVYGQGHVVCYNRVSNTGDGVNISQGQKPHLDLRKHCVNCDFYNNDLFNCMDNHVETDSGSHNIRVYNNRCRNALESMSAQPTYGGPIYFIRNELYNVQNGWKLNVNPAGVVLYNNTTCATKGASVGTGSSNAHCRNNIFLYAQPWRKASIVQMGSLTPYSTFDYNVYRYVPSPKDAKKPAYVMYLHARKPYQTRYLYFRKGTPEEAFQEFVKRTKQEQHGMLADFDVFMKAGPPEEGVTYTIGRYDLRLKADAKLIDKGVVLPQITDGYTGAAPDIGAHEFGKPAPHYGPRP